MSARDPHLARARDYPYAIPGYSYVYRDQGMMPFDPTLCRYRTPVLAIGSNQSPQQLARKFGHDASHVVPVQRARLPHFDVVYSAHITRYGAVPAMLQHCFAAVVDIAITWLDDRQLELMHASEIAAANYAFAALEDVTVMLDDGRIETRALAYISSRGQLSFDDNDPVALAAIACSGRRYPALTTGEVLEQLRTRIAPELNADTFVQRLIDDSDYRRRLTDRLSRDAVGLQHPVRILRSRTQT